MSVDEAVTSQTEAVAPQIPVQSHRRAPASLRERLRDRWSHFSLVQQFGITAAIVIVVGMTGLGLWVSSRIEKGVVQNTASAAALYLSDFVQPHIQSIRPDGTLPSSAHAALDKLLAETMLGSEVVDLKVWGEGGRLIYSRQPDQIGQVFPVTDKLRGAFAGNVEPEFDDLHALENVLERALQKPILEVYVPVRSAAGDKVIAVAEVYEIAESLANELARARLGTVLVVGFFALAMLGSLFHIVRRGSRIIDNQQLALADRVAALSRLLEHNQELRQKVAQSSRDAAENNERFLRRIGADLHDGPLQLLGFVMLRMDALRTQLKQSDAQSDRDFETVRNALRDTVAELRHLSAGLSVPELENADLAEALSLAIHNHVRRTGTNVEADIADDLPQELPVAVITCLYRLTQEGLNNALRHAGGIGQKVTARVDGNAIHVEIADSGTGIAQDAAQKSDGGLGLAGLKYRIASLGGVFEMHSNEARGTRLVARFALDRENAIS